jgi:hypothetical protein
LFSNTISLRTSFRMKNQAIQHSSQSQFVNFIFTFLGGRWEDKEILNWMEEKHSTNLW